VICCIGSTAETECLRCPAGTTTAAPVNTFSISDELSLSPSPYIIKYKQIIDFKSLKEAFGFSPIENEKTTAKDEQHFRTTVYNTLETLYMNMLPLMIENYKVPDLYTRIDKMSEILSRVYDMRDSVLSNESLKDYVFKFTNLYEPDSIYPKHYGYFYDIIAEFLSLFNDPCWRHIGDDRFVFPETIEKQHKQYDFDLCEAVELVLDSPLTDLATISSNLKKINSNNISNRINSLYISEIVAKLKCFSDKNIAFDENHRVFIAVFKEMEEFVGFEKTPLESGEEGVDQKEGEEEEEAVDQEEEEEEEEEEAVEGAATPLVAKGGAATAAEGEESATEAVEGAATPLVAKGGAATAAEGEESATEAVAANDEFYSERKHALIEALEKHKSRKTRGYILHDRTAKLLPQKENIQLIVQFEYILKYIYCVCSMHGVVIDKYVDLLNKSETQDVVENVKSNKNISGEDVATVGGASVNLSEEESLANSPINSSNLESVNAPSKIIYPWKWVGKMLKNVINEVKQRTEDDDMPEPFWDNACTILHVFVDYLRCFSENMPQNADLCLTDTVIRENLLAEISKVREVNNENIKYIESVYEEAALVPEQEKSLLSQAAQAVATGIGAATPQNNLAQVGGNKNIRSSRKTLKRRYRKILAKTKFNRR
jgi:hypothetical protein